MCIFINFDRDASCENVQIAADMCNDIIHAVKSLTDINLSMGISSLKKSLINIGRAYEEGLETLSEKFYVHKNIFIYTGHKNINGEDILLTINTYFNSILKYVQSGGYESAADSLGKMFSIYKQAGVSIRDTKNISMILFSCITGFLPGTQSSNTGICINDSSRILHSQSVEEVYKLLLSTIGLVISETQKADMNNHSVIAIIDKYIKENYSRDLTLTAIAQHVHLNSSYLSRLYRKDTGETLTEKITKIRIEKAKELLANTDLKIYEVSSRVGIENTNYFSILFKKYTSMYPKEYRVSSSRV
jgi:two-component system response regulator YesN